MKNEKVQYHTIIVFDTVDMMLQVCGVNNDHIALLEQLFDGVIYASDNELKIIPHTIDIVDDFKKLIIYLVECIQKNIDINRDFISAAYYQLFGNTDKNNTTIHDNIVPPKNDMSMITVPFTDKRVIARTTGQYAIVKSLEHYDLSFLVGPAGTGKTLITTAYALSLLLQKKIQHFIITRPVVEAGEKLGFLPGDLVQKILPYLRPIYDVLYELGGESMIDHLLEKHQIEIAPLAYMRGRTLKDCMVMLDEAQNCTSEQMRMFLTRLGDGCKAVVTGDPSQSDLRHERNGLEEAINIFRHISFVNIVQLNDNDIQRSKLTKIVIDAYAKYAKQKEDE